MKSAECLGAVTCVTHFSQWSAGGDVSVELVYAVVQTRIFMSESVICTIVTESTHAHDGEQASSTAWHWQEQSAGVGNPTTAGLSL